MAVFIHAINDPQWAADNIGTWKTPDWTRQYMQFVCDRPHSIIIGDVEFIHMHATIEEFVRTGALNVIWDSPRNSSLYITIYMDHLWDGGLWHHLQDRVQLNTNAKRQLVYSHYGIHSLHQVLRWIYTDPTKEAIGLWLLQNIPNANHMTNAVPPGGNSVLYYALTEPRTTREIVRLLLEAGASPFERCDNNTTPPLHEDLKASLLHEAALRAAQDINAVPCRFLPYLVERTDPERILHGGIWPNFMDVLTPVQAWPLATWILRYLKAKCEWGDIPVVLPAWIIAHASSALTIAHICDLWDKANILLYTATGDSLTRIDAVLSACTPRAALSFIGSDLHPSISLHIAPLLYRYAGYDYRTIESVLHSMTHVRRPERLLWLLPHYHHHRQMTPEEQACIDALFASSNCTPKIRQRVTKYLIQP